MAVANMVTNPKVEIEEAEVGVEIMEMIEASGTAPKIEAEGEEIFLRADGETLPESRVLGTLLLG